MISIFKSLFVSKIQCFLVNAEVDLLLCEQCEYRLKKVRLILQSLLLETKQGPGTLVTRYWEGTQHICTRTLYNFKNIGGGGGGAAVPLLPCRRSKPSKHASQDRSLLAPWLGFFFFSISTQSELFDSIKWKSLSQTSFCQKFDQLNYLFLFTWTGYNKTERKRKLAAYKRSVLTVDKHLGNTVSTKVYLPVLPKLLL